MDIDQTIFYSFPQDDSNSSIPQLILCSPRLRRSVQLAWFVFTLATLFRTTGWPEWPNWELEGYHRGYKINPGTCTKQNLYPGIPATPGLGCVQWFQHNGWMISVIMSSEDKLKSMFDIELKSKMFGSLAN